MNLLNLSPALLLLGLGAIAGLLFLLQRLRVRYRNVEVVTSMFWKQAVEETRARILVRRFRHPLAYLLVLAIASLLWLAFAGPRWDRRGEADVVFLLDASAGMGWGDRFVAAGQLLIQEAARIPAERRRIFVCDASPRLLLDRDEALHLLESRLDTITPEACPATVETELLLLAATAPGGTGLEVLVVGDAPVRQEILDRLPVEMTVRRLARGEPPARTGNRAIAAVGVAEAASGAFDRVDVRIEVAGEDPTPPAVTLGGEAVNQPLRYEDGAYYLRDLPAQGDTLEVSLPSTDPLPIDDQARLTLPTRNPVTVALAPEIDERLRWVVESDPALVEVRSEASPQVRVGAVGPADRPALELVPGHALVLVHEAPLDAFDAWEMESRFSNLGLDRVGRTLGPGLEGPFTLSLQHTNGSQRQVRMGTELLTDDYDFVRSTAFPLFVAQSLRWLADTEVVEPFAEAGARLAHPNRLSIAGAAYRPPRVGSYTTRDGKLLAVSLGALRGDDTLPMTSRSREGRVWPELLTWAILLALVLTGAEWWWFQKGRIP